MKIDRKELHDTEIYKENLEWVFKQGLVQILPLPPTSMTELNLVREDKKIDMERLKKILPAALLEYRFSDRIEYFSPTMRYKNPIDGRKVIGLKKLKKFKWLIVVDMRRQDVTSEVFHRVKEKHIKFDERILFGQKNKGLQIDSPDQIQSTLEEMIEDKILPERRYCKFCGKELIDNRPNKIFCDIKCRSMWNKYKMRKEEFDRVKKPRGRKKKVIPPESTSPAP